MEDWDTAAHSPFTHGLCSDEDVAMTTSPEVTQEAVFQFFFCSSSFRLFFCTFWWTTFSVVRKFPKNSTRNVRASMNTCGMQWSQANVSQVKVVCQGVSMYCVCTVSYLPLFTVIPCSKFKQSHCIVQLPKLRNTTHVSISAQTHIQ